MLRKTKEHAPTLNPINQLKNLCEGNKLLAK